MTTPESGFDLYTPGIKQQIGMLAGSRFELANLMTDDLLKLSFVNHEHLTLVTLNKPEDDTYPNEFRVLASSLGGITCGNILISGATQRGTMLMPGVLQRWSHVNLNMIEKYRPDSIDATNDFEKAYKEHDPNFGLDEEGYYLNAIRWVGGRNTPELAQVCTQRPGETGWINQFL